MKAIDAKFLEGLTYRTAEVKAAKGENGKKARIITATEAPLTPDKVLDWKDCGDAVVIVAADGRKHKVAKTKAAGK